MTGGSTIVEFWRDESSAASDASQADDILLLKQASLNIDEDDSDDGAGDGWVKRIRVGLGLLAIGWVGFAGAIAATLVLLLHMVGVL